MNKCKVVKLLSFSILALASQYSLASGHGFKHKEWGYAGSQCNSYSGTMHKVSNDEATISFISNGNKDKNANMVLSTKARTYFLDDVNENYAQPVYDAIINGKDIDFCLASDELKILAINVKDSIKGKK